MRIGENLFLGPWSRVREQCRPAICRNVHQGQDRTGPGRSGGPSGKRNRTRRPGPLVYCFEQADQLDGARLDDLVVQPGGVLGERPVTLDGIGQRIEITAEGRLLPANTPATAIAIPYFQWDNRDGRPMRVWVPRYGF